jgi:hypothetical protein
MPIAAFALALAALLAGPASGADIDYIVTESPAVTVNSGGSSDIATVVLSETAGIVCYADWAGDKDGWCNALDLSVAAAAPSKGEATQLAGVKLQHFTLERFSDSQAVVCYVRLGSPDGSALCNVLEVQAGDRSLAVGDSMEFDSDTIYLHQLDVASFSQTSGVVCYGDTNSEPNLKVKCVPFALDPATRSLTLAGEAARVDDEVHHVQQVIVTAFSDTSAVVCYALEAERLDEGGFSPDDYASWCSPISFDGAALAVGQWIELDQDATYDLSVARLTDGSGVLCYTDGGDSYGKCMPLSFDNGTISLPGEVLEVSADTTSNLTLAAMSPTAAMVCFMAGSNHTGKCSGLVMSHGAELAMGDDVDLDSGAFDAVEDCAEGWEVECGFFLSVSAYASPLNMNGLACYAGLGGDEGARCSMLEVPPPTTTTTATTFSEPSSTTPHTTTETSSTIGTTTETSFTVAPQRRLQEARTAEESPVGSSSHQDPAANFII